MFILEEMFLKNEIKHFTREMSVQREKLPFKYITKYIHNNLLGERRWETRAKRRRDVRWETRPRKGEERGSIGECKRGSRKREGDGHGEGRREAIREWRRGKVPSHSSYLPPLPIPHTSNSLFFLLFPIFFPHPYSTVPPFFPASFPLYGRKYCFQM